MDPVNYEPDKFEPLYFLYFSENSFVSPHYQSIRPNSNPTGSIETLPMVQESHDDPQAESFNNLSSKILDFDDITPPICESTAISSVWAVLESKIKWFSSAEITEDVFSFGRVLDKKQSPYLAHGDCHVSVYTKISRNHFTIRRIGNNAILEDHSAAGTYVENKLVGKGKTVQLMNENIISIGNELDLVKPEKKNVVGFKFILKSIKPAKRAPVFDDTTVLESPTILEVSSGTPKSKKSKVSNDASISRILRSSIRITSSKLSKSGVSSENIIKNRRRKKN